MSKSEKYDPTALPQLVRDRIDKKARGEFVQVGPPSLLTGKSMLSSTAQGSTAASDDLVAEFTSTLLGQPAFKGDARALRETRTKNSNPSVLAGTNAFFSLPNKQEVSNSKFEVNVASASMDHAVHDLTQYFELETDYAGRVGVQVRRGAAGLEVTLSLKKEIAQKGQSVLVQLLQTQLGSNLGLPVEVKIECSRN